MGFLSEVAEAGGRDQLDTLLADFIIGDDEPAKLALLEAIDENGLRSEMTLMAIAALQRQERVKPTLYTKLSALSSELKKRPTNGASPKTTAGAPKTTTSGVAAPKTAAKPGRKMTLNWTHLFVINIVDRGEFTRDDIAKLIGMDDKPMPTLKGMNAVDWIIDDSLRAYRFESKLENGKYSFRSKNEWKRYQIDRWLKEGRPFPKDWETNPVMPSKELWSGFTLL